MQHNPFHSLRLAILPAILLLGLMALVSSFSPIAHAAGIVVDDAGDTLHSPGCADDGTTSPCTLRDAITFANSNAGADTITFSISNATITLGSALPAITESVTIDGTAQNITVSGNNTYRILLISSGTTSLTALTLANGSASSFGGGAIRAELNTALNVTNSTFSNNYDGSPIGGGAIFVDPGITVNVTNSTFSGNHTNTNTPGGAIFNNGTLNVTNSTFSGNYTDGAANGGAILNAGTLNVTNSTFSGNYTDGNGGAIDNSINTLNVTNSTFSGNYSTGGSGGGIYRFNGTVTLKNTIIANSTGGGDCGGTIIADDYNIDSDGTCDNASQFTTGAIALGALASNGGPTQTMAIDENSAAFNFGDNAVCAAAPVNNLDQRGQTRPQGMYCDTGAYEFVYSGWQTGPNFVVNSSADTEDGSCDELGQGVFNQDCTLREAILAANALSGADDITFDIPGTDGGCTAANTCTILLTGNLPHITDAVTINGTSNNGHITVDGANTYQIFFVEADSELIGLTIANGSGFLSSGGVYNSGAGLLISSSTFIHNSGASGGHAKNDGGGLLTIVNSTFFDPVSATAIGNTGGSTLKIYNSTIDGNNVGGSVGISNVSGTTELYNTIVSNNASVDCSVGTGSLTADSYNLDNDGTCDSATSKTVAEINLQALADNGGATYTMALVIPGAALNAGDNAVCEAIPVSFQDQRGVLRPQGSACDVGAYEAEGTTAVNVTNVRGKVNAGGKVLVRWKTTNESQIAGFNIYRKTQKGEWKQLNTNFKQAKHPGDATGESYRFVNRAVKAGQTYRYKIQVVYLDNHIEWTDAVKVKIP